MTFCGRTFSAEQLTLMRHIAGEFHRRRVTKMDRYHRADGSAGKLVLVYPLCPNVQPRLRQASPPRFAPAEPEADWA